MHRFPKWPELFQGLSRSSAEPSSADEILISMTSLTPTQLGFCRGVPMPFLEIAIAVKTEHETSGADPTLHSGTVGRLSATQMTAARGFSPKRQWLATPTRSIATPVEGTWLFRSRLWMFLTASSSLKGAASAKWRGKFRFRGRPTSLPISAEV